MGVELAPGRSAAPADWTATTIGDLADIQRGASPRPITDSKWFDSRSGVGWVRISDANRAQGRVLTATADHLSPDGVANSRFLPTGTVIMSICATIGIPVITGFDTCIHDGFVSFTRLRGVDREFLLFKLRELEPTFRGLGQTGSQANLNSDLVRRCPVVIPSSLAEQRQIAEVLADLEDAVRALDGLIGKKRSVASGAARTLLDGAKRLDADAAWTPTAISSLGHFLKGRGLTKSDLVNVGVPCIRYGEIYTTHHHWIRSLSSRIAPSTAALSTRLRQGDVLFTGSGETAAEIGKCAAFLDNYEAYAGGDVIILRDHGQDARFLGYALNSPSVCRQRERLGQGDAVVHISARALGQIEISLPGIQEQRRIAEVLADLDADIDVLVARRDKLRQVQRSTARELLSGTVRLS